MERVYDQLLRMSQQMMDQHSRALSDLQMLEREAIRQQKSELLEHQRRQRECLSDLTRAVLHPAGSGCKGVFPAHPDDAAAPDFVRAVEAYFIGDAEDGPKEFKRGSETPPRDEELMKVAEGTPGSISCPNVYAEPEPVHATESEPHHAPTPKGTTAIGRDDQSPMEPNVAEAAPEATVSESTYGGVDEFEAQSAASVGQNPAPRDSKVGRQAKRRQRKQKQQTVEDLTMSDINGNRARSRGDLNVPLNVDLEHTDTIPSSQRYDSHIESVAEREEASLQERREAVRQTICKLREKYAVSPQEEARATSVIATLEALEVDLAERARDCSRRR